jgi:NodT family efflux transporter outer membrane factor (OMF) lipoprotein
MLVIHRFKKYSMVFIMLLSACTVGPDYVKPSAPTPVTDKFKEANKNWKSAQPQDMADRGQWWEVFHEPELNEMESRLNISNQTILSAKAQYEQALALVDEARASYFPTFATSASITRQRQVSGSFSNSSSSINQTGATSSTTTTSTAAAGSSSHTAHVSTFHSLLLNGTWEPDIWGSIGRNVEANESSAEASQALLASTRLSAQASLAQYYFELRGVDKDQQLLDDAVKGYQDTLKLTQFQYRSGVASQADVVSAQSQLEIAKAQAINNKINRATYEHAIAILVGVPPEDFSISAEPIITNPPPIPLSVPSVLLERRPDIAQAERLMAQANAQIGVAVSAYYPALTLTANGSVTNPNYNRWFSIPALSWSLGPQLAETIFDGGLRKATVAAAKANYQSTVASYREIVLAAFQDVEDNLASLRILADESTVQDRAARDARKSLKLVINQYKAGTVPYSSVITAQISTYTAEKNAADVHYLRMTSAVGLIKALGGGWDANQVTHPPV